MDDVAAQITLYVTSMQTRVPCPLCHVQTPRIHGQYGCTLADLPWGAYRVRLQLLVEHVANTKFVTHLGHEATYVHMGLVFPV